MMPPALILRAQDLSVAQVAALAEWRAELGRLTEQRRACLRTAHRQLCTHLSSAIHGAHSEIAEALRPAMGELVSGVAATISPCFERLGDARAAVLRFPAFADLSAFLRGPDTNLDLSPLAELAEETAALVSKILMGEIVWRWEGAAK